MTKRPKGALCDKDLKNEPRLSGFVNREVKAPGGILPYMGYMGMCRCEGYGFQAVYSRIGYINQNVWV